MPSVIFCLKKEHASTNSPSENEQDPFYYGMPLLSAKAEPVKKEIPNCFPYQNSEFLILYIIPLWKGV